MDFLNLPVEIGSKIFNYMDTKTRINFYNSCKELQDYIGSWCQLKNIVLSRNTLATVNTLRDKFFIDLGHHIVELNLSGVPDLTAENLKPHIKRFVNLKSLDVTFTQIYLENIAEICPLNLKKIGINFYKIFRNYNYEKFTSQSEVFFKERPFEEVHFVVMDLNISILPIQLCNDLSSIKDLKITIVDNYGQFLKVYQGEINSDANEVEINFDKLTVTVRDCAVSHKTSKQLEIATRLNFKRLEYIFIMTLEEIEIYVSPLLAKIFTINCRDLKIQVSSYLPLNFLLDGNIVFKAWNKDTINFDETFYKNLLTELKDYFPNYFCVHDNTWMKITEAPSTWVCIDGCGNFDKIPYLPDKITLTNFCRRDGTLKNCRRPISICKTSNLQHLTFLMLNNVLIRNMFFTVLFEQCPKLTTLNVYMESHETVLSYMESLSKSIHLAKLKNFMLTSEDIKYEAIFGILCCCPSLENVYICEYERELDLDEEFYFPTNIVCFIEKCENLYSLFISSDMSAEMLTMMMSPLRTMAQKLGREYINITVCNYNWSWNPFADVFCPSPLHISN